MAISNTTLNSSAVAIYESFGNNAITTVIVCNKSVYNAAAPTDNQSLLYLYAVPSGQTQSDSHIIVNGLPVPAGETVSFDQEKMVLANGDMLYAKTDSASNLVATVSSLAV